MKNKNEEDKVFYDVHMHAYDFSHPGMLSFINRFLLNRRITLHELLTENAFSLLKKLIFRAKSKGGIKAFISITIIVFIILLVLVGIYSIVYVFRVSVKSDNLMIYSLYVSLVLVIVFSIIFFLSFKYIINRNFNRSKLKHITNTFSLFENDIARQFRYIELDYMSLNKDIYEKIKKFPSDISSEDINSELEKLWKSSGIDESFEINGKRYKKAFISPLVMDFGYKGIGKHALDDVHYHLQPRKAVINQTRDLFTGILQYYGATPRKTDSSVSSAFQILDIYPFMGINPDNYNTISEIEILLNKYFNDFDENDTIKKRKEILKGRKKRFLETNEEFLKKEGDNSETFLLDSSLFYFAGIKVYPPLGFDPWPKGNSFIETKNEADNLLKKKRIDSLKSKVKFIYQYCLDKRIPITTHCSDGGFRAEDKETHLENTSPKKWSAVLEKYQGLTLNLAHSGVQTKADKSNPWGKWLKFILKMIESEDKSYSNLYIDLADIGENNCNYRSLCYAIKAYTKKFKKNEVGLKEKFLKKLNKRILFGTDFMVNLFGVDSYLNHLQIFSEDESFDNIVNFLNKDDFCTVNAERFLFGELK